MVRGAFAATDVIYEKIDEALSANGFEVEPMGPRSFAIQAMARWNCFQ